MTDTFDRVLEVFYVVADSLRVLGRDPVAQSIRQSLMRTDSIRDKVVIGLSPYVTRQPEIEALFSALAALLAGGGASVFVTAAIRDDVFIKHARAASEEKAVTWFMLALNGVLRHDECRECGSRIVDVFGSAAVRDEVIIPIVSSPSFGRWSRVGLITTQAFKKLIASPHFRTRESCEGILLPLADAAASNRDSARCWIDTLIVFLNDPNAHELFATPRGRHAFVRMAWKHCCDQRSADAYLTVLHQMLSSECGRVAFTTTHVRDVLPRILEHLETPDILVPRIRLMTLGHKGCALFATPTTRDELFIPLAHRCPNGSILGVLDAMICCGGDAARRVFATATVRDSLFLPIVRKNGSSCRSSAVYASALLENLTGGDNDDGDAPRRCALFADRDLFLAVSRHVHSTAVRYFIGALRNVLSHVDIRDVVLTLRNEWVRLALLVDSAVAAELFLCTLHTLARCTTFDFTKHVTGSRRERLFCALGAQVRSASGARSFCEALSIMLHAGPSISATASSRATHDVMGKVAEYATTAHAAASLALLCQKLAP